MREIAYTIKSDSTGEHVANIYFDERTQIYSAELLSKTDRPSIFGFEALGILVPNPTHDVILTFLQSRVAPPNRQCLSELLASVGMTEYNWKELIKLNKGKRTSDHYRVEEYCK